MTIAIVTGASSGIGKEFVRQLEWFYKDLDEIWVIARREERLKELRSRMMLKLRIFEGDLLEQEVYDKILQTLLDEKPDVRMLVNSAGFGKSGKAVDIDKNTQLEMIDTNCRSLTHMTLLCIPYMSKGSRIVNMASAAAFCPQPSFAVYAATKSYVLSFSRALRFELSKKGIVVTSVCPGPVKTEFFEISGTNVNILKKASMARADKVVRKALLDVRKMKEVSVYGTAINGARILTKLFPHRLIINILAHL